MDIRRPEGADIVRALARTADVFIENFRPGVVARHGLGYEDIRAQRPDVVYCSISGYGQDGPDRDLAGHDLDFSARAEILMGVLCRWRGRLRPRQRAVGAPGC